ncbi:MAG TPA: hypothetical protein VJ400_08335 [Thermoplasmata archaeon]|nr:hypothetical protein [Thermoplasmata archaeon]
MRPPLGLPTGSVRAVLALILCATMWYLVYRGEVVPELLASAVLLVVAFYFGVRSTASPLPAVAPGQAPGVPQPLYLPRGAVRTILLIGFLAIIVYLWIGARAIPPEFLLILQVLASYLVGFTVSVAVNRRIQKGLGPMRGVAWVRNLLAIIALAVTGIVCISILFGFPEFVPADAEKALTWVVAFYFGSRLG